MKLIQFDDPIHNEPERKIAINPQYITGIMSNGPEFTFIHTVNHTYNIKSPYHTILTILEE